MQSRWIPETIDYDGRQLRSHFTYSTLGLLGDSIVAFRGACDVSIDALVDLEDRREGGVIVSRSMLHFLAEHFDGGLDRTVLRQRLLISIAADVIEARLGARPLRRGDDLFRDDRKLSVSIATASPVSTLIHLGLNLDPTGAPVPAIGLYEMGLDGRIDGSAADGESCAEQELAVDILQRYTAEMEGVDRARRKVRGVS